MDKVEHPYPVLLERLQTLERSIYILNLVNNDLREILHKKKPLPQFVQDSFKRSTMNRSKTTPALAQPPAEPIETEEMRLAASVIDKAKRAIENLGEKKSKSVTSLTTSTTQPIKAQMNRSKNPPAPSTSTSSRPSSANTVTSTKPSTVTPTEAPVAQPAAPVRRFVPAHMKAPFLTQPEKKRRPSSSVRSSVRANVPNQKTTSNTTTTTAASARRSLSQQRRQLSTSMIPSMDDVSPSIVQTADLPIVPLIRQDPLSNAEYETNDLLLDVGTTSALLPSDSNPNEPSDYFSNEQIEIDGALVPQPIILNRALVKPLRRLWKQNQNLRLRLQRDLSQKTTSSPPFIHRLNEQIQSSINSEQVRIPNIDVLLQLAMKLRAIILHVLENSPFDHLESALKRLNTLKYLVNRYQYLFSPKTNLLVSIDSLKNRAKNSPRNSDDLLNLSSKKSRNRIVRYTDDGQLIAFTEVRFQQFENECRWIELNWHEQMIRKYKQTINSNDQNPLELYRELMSLVTGLQTSTPIVVENRL